MDFRQLIGDQSASDQQTQQPATTGVNFNALVKKVSPEVSTEPTPSLDVSKYIDKDKLDFAQTVSPLIGMSKYISYSQSENIAAKLAGPGVKPKEATGRIKDIGLSQQIATLSYQQMQDGETPERAAKIKELEGQLSNK